MGGERRPGLLRSARNDARHGGVHGVASTRGSAEKGGRHDVSRSVQRTGLCGAAHRRGVAVLRARPSEVFRSEEHTSELQSLMRISYAVFCLKKKITKRICY